MHYYRHKRAQRSLLFRAPGLVIAALAVGASGGSTLPDLISSWQGRSDTGWSCDIKGNISIETGEKIYHVPGQRFYDSSSETEARAAGWRRAYR